MARSSLYTVALVLFALAQGALSWSIRDVRPSLGILPDLPQQNAVDAIAFGDSQFLYRYLALTLQNAGDNGGRVTPLKNYDYSKVVAWLRLLNGLDHQSHWVVAMANGYFGQTQNLADVRPIIRYMQEDVAHAPRIKWPWLVNAVHLSRHRLDDNWLALDNARQAGAYDYTIMNAATLQMPPLILEDLGQLRAARAEMVSVQARRSQGFRAEDNFWAEDFIFRIDQKLNEGFQ